MALSPERDQRDVTTQNLSSPFWKVLQVLAILEFYSQVAPSLPRVGTASLNTSSWEQTTLPASTPLSPKGDYLWGWDKARSCRLSAPSVCARAPHLAWQCQRREGGLCRQAVCGPVSALSPWAPIIRGGSALNLYSPATAHKLTTLYVFVTHNITLLIIEVWLSIKVCVHGTADLWILPEDNMWSRNGFAIF